MAFPLFCSEKWELEKTCLLVSRLTFRFLISVRLCTRKHSSYIQLVVCRLQHTCNYVEIYPVLSVVTCLIFETENIEYNNWADDNHKTLFFISLLGVLQSFHLDRQIKNLTLKTALLHFTARPHRTYSIVHKRYV